MEKLQIFIYVYQTGVQSIPSMFILGGLGACHQQKIFECQKSEFGGTLATKITCII